MDKPDICFLQYDLREGGAERKVCTLANYFVSRGRRVEIGLFGRNEVAYHLDPRVKVTYIHRDSFEYRSHAGESYHTFRKRVFAAACGVAGLAGNKTRERLEDHLRKRDNYTLPIRRYISDRSSTVFISMMVTAYLEILRVMEPVWGKRIPVPYLVMDCNNPLFNASPVIREKREKEYPKASRVLVMTEGAKNFFGPGIRNKCEVIPNPVRDDLPEPFTGLRRKTVVTFCRLNVQKNLPLLIGAFAAFHQRFTDYTLEIYGEGEERESLERLIVQKGLSDTVRIYPFDPEVHRKIRDCAMFVCSSDWEGFCNSVMEALALGMPVISTNYRFGASEMIRDHVNGILVRVRDEKGLADAMAEVAADPALAAGLGESAREAREVYSVEGIGRRWLEVVEKAKHEVGGNCK